VVGNDAGDGFVNKTPAGADQVVYPVSVGDGGTGATSVADARANLGIDAAADAAVDARALTHGRHSLSIPAAAWRPQPTDGCSVEIIGETATHKVTTSTRAFDAATPQHAQFAFRAPKSSDETATLSGTIVWQEAAGATAHDVVWQMEAQAQGDGDAVDGAWGAPVTGTDTGSAGTRRFVSFSGLVPGGGWAEGDMLVLRLSRKAADAADTLDVDALLFEVQLDLDLNAGNDA